MARVSSLGGMSAVTALDMRRVMRVVAIAVGEPVEWSHRAIAKDLPRPDLIEREVRQAFPNIDFAIVLDD